MKNEYLLISDGSSDKALIPVINYLLYQITGKYFNGERIDFYRFKISPKTLSDKILQAINLYPEINLIFIHRDAEKEEITKREIEILKSIKYVSSEISNTCSYIKVIPIRMTEAWLLIDEYAIKRASGNPNSLMRLKLPTLKSLERIPDPKSKLSELIKIASGLSGRRLNTLNIGQSIYLVSQYIQDYSPLEKLTAYNYLKNQIENYWDSNLT